ncbi:hypothetical protein TB2_007785 [Malus domestica]
MGLRRSTRLNVTIGGAAPPRVSTTRTTTVATLVAIRSEVHGTTTTARVVPPKQSQAVSSKAHGTKAMTQTMSLQAQRELNALLSRAQASHSRASCTEHPSPLSWFPKQPKSVQDYLNHPDQSSSWGHFHHISRRI